MSPRTSRKDIERRYDEEKAKLEKPIRLHSIKHHHHRHHRHRTKKQKGNSSSNSEISDSDSENSETGIE